jgi:hypothetical protein
MLHILKKKGNSVITAVFVLLIAGSICFTWHNYRRNHPPYSPEINRVLFMAGDNRSQLEKVLKHYSRNPSDSLKFRAAEFLIANMPGKYSLEYDAPFEDVMALYTRWDEHENRQEVHEVFGVNKEQVKEDVKHITADYLINNIELSFKVWREQPWGKDVPFDVFCEEILPYRVANEPLENWREKILASFSKLNRSFKEQPGIKAVDACITVNRQLPRLKLFARMPAMNYSMIMTTMRGMCNEMSALAVFSMRALGIPVAQEQTPKWPRRNVGHTWNSVYDSAGRRFSFMGTEAIPGVGHHGSRMPKSKVYRLTYAIQNNINLDNADIPPSLRNRCMKDVSEEYNRAFVAPFDRKEKAAALSSDSLPIRRQSVIHNSLYKRGLGIVLDPLPAKGVGVEIPIKYPPTNNTGYAYLAAIGENTWHIVGWGKTDSKNIHFGTAGRNILYLPLYYENDSQTPANYPFIINDNDSVLVFEPDTGNYRQLLATVIFPSNNTLMKRMENGVFEGANRSDFSDAQVLYTVKKIDGAYFYTAKIRNSARFRYVRYVSPENSHCNVAEIGFYNSTGEKLSGKPVGIPEMHPNQGKTNDKAFDGDISTFYEAEQPGGAWTGLDLGKPQTISTIRYFPRDEGNGIYEGVSYELYYWNDRRWQFYEKQTATSHTLTFRVPANALFYLRNATTDKSGKWFALNKNDEQWWM